MTESFIHSTENDNLYLYDVQHSLSMLIHPELSKAHEKIKNIDPYYLEKYKYLKTHGLFGKAESVNFETTLDEAIVKEYIINARQIVFETTDYCNLRCSYCSLGELYEFGKKDHKNINTSYAVNLLKYIFALKPEKTKLMIGFFGGEPLVNFNFIENIINEANSFNNKKLEFEFNMTTNATLIHKHIQFLVNHNFTLLISLDGDEEGHSYRTFANNNNNSFHKVIENIDMIQRDYPEYFENKIEFNAVLNNRNSVKSIYEFIYNRYHKIPKISQINWGDINPEKKDRFEKMFHNHKESEEKYQNEGSSLLSETHTQLILFKQLRDFIHKHSINSYISNQLYLLYDKVNPLPTRTCFPFSRKIYLNTNHNMLPCEKVSYKYSMGYVGDHININTHEIVQKYNSYYEHFKNICQDCYAVKDCSICLLTLENLDKLGTDEFACPAFFNQDRFKHKLNQIFSFLEKNTEDYLKIVDSKMIE